jgi:hypothetical protein
LLSISDINEGTQITITSFDKLTKSWVLTNPDPAVFIIKKRALAFSNDDKFTFNAFRRANKQSKPSIFNLKHFKIIEDEY